jgi:hypothetical protein
MFQDLDSTIAKILNDPASPTKVANADVSFLTPDKNFAPAQATVDLFLYDVKENRELRDPTPILEKKGTGYVRKPPPLRVDCSYIVTTWSSKNGAAKVAEEHGLLGEALIWLTRFGTIPEKYWQGSMAIPRQLYAPPTMVAQVDPNKNAGEFWDALAIPPRPAFYLTVTIAMDLGVEETGPLVTTHSSNAATTGDSGRESWVQIGGTIRDLTGTVVGNALVDVTDAGLRTTSDADGRYRFLRVPTGLRTLRVVAVGFQPKTQPLVVPGLPEEYDVSLTPL